MTDNVCGRENPSPGAGKSVTTAPDTKQHRGAPARCSGQKCCTCQSGLGSSVHSTGTEQDKLKDRRFYNRLTSSESRCHERCKGKGRGNVGDMTGNWFDCTLVCGKAALPRWGTSREYGHGPDQVTDRVHAEWDKGAEQCGRQTAQC